MKKDEGSHKLDQIDLRILNRLQSDARITNQELADDVGLSPSPCLQRVKRMENNGVISGYNAISICTRSAAMWTSSPPSC